MAAIATRAPGFAGMFWDSAGRLIIRTTPDADPSIVLTTIRDPENSRAFRGLHDALLENRFEVIPNATFDFRALMSLRDSLWFALQDGSVSSVSIDEARNTVRIGTTTQAGEDRIRDAAMRRLIPTGALAFQRGLVVRDSSIRNKFRPIPGGVQVSNSLGQCTIGANVTTEYGNGFVTASHCTSIPWQADGLDFYQPSSDLVGYEIADPTPSQLGRVCSPYVLCRLSDAAFILYDQSSWAELARIARTEGLGSTTIDSYNHRFVIADEGGWLLVGAHVNKIGRTSGWTAGEVTGVTETCVDLINWMTPPLLVTNVLQCQTEANYWSDDGDSGAPVFSWDFSGDQVTLQGIHTGRNGRHPGGSRAYFSPWISVAFELGAVLSVFTPLP